MKVAIIITTPDFAGLNVKEHLLRDFPFEKTNELFENVPIYHLSNNFHEISIYTSNKRCVMFENPDIDAELFIFPTTHRSSANTNSLSCHTQGNWAEAELGGIPRNLSFAPALLLKEVFKLLNNYKNLDEEITMEVTHHGPQLEKPTIFIEIGSDETQWKRTDLGKIIASTVMNILYKEIPFYPTAIGMGGPHYCNNFNDIQLNSEIALGHICPKHMIEKIDKEMIIQAIEKTMPKPKIAIIDWKGMGPNKQRILDILNEIGIEVKKTKDLK